MAVPVVLRGPSMRESGAPMTAEGAGGVSYSAAAGPPCSEPMNSRSSLKSISISHFDAVLVARFLRWALCGGRGEGQGSNEAAFGELHLEGVLALRTRILQSLLCCMAEDGSAYRAANECLLRLRRTPRLGSYSAERDACRLNLLPVHAHNDGGGGKRELVGCAVPQLQVERLRPDCRRGQRHAGDDIAGLQHILAVRSVARHQEEVVDRNAALTPDTLNLDGRLESGQRDVHVGGVGCDAVLAGAEDRQRAVVTVDGGTSAAGFALVAGVRGVAEVDATRALQQV